MLCGKILTNGFKYCMITKKKCGYYIKVTYTIRTNRPEKYFQLSFLACVFFLLTSKHKRSLLKNTLKCHLKSQQIINVCTDKQTFVQRNIFELNKYQA